VAPKPAILPHLPQPLRVPMHSVRLSMPRHDCLQSVCILQCRGVDPTPLQAILMKAFGSLHWPRSYR
jgi:hypothetical protein